MQGKIIKGVGGSYLVRTEAGDFTCKARGIFRYKNQKPMIGDDVDIELIPGEEGCASIEEIFPRSNQLIRPAVANVDQAVIMMAVRDPRPSLNLLDRFLIQMSMADIPVIICFNKMDLASDGEIEPVLNIYESIGYTCMTLCTVTGAGLDNIRKITKGKTTVWAGPSGVGKSSVINALMPEMSMDTGEVSEKIKRGRHTTRHVQLLCCDSCTYVCDTPGFSSLDIPDIAPGSLQTFFKEFEAYADKCRFRGCVHIGERECAVKDACAEGKISKLRYESYRFMYDQLKQRKKY